MAVVNIMAAKEEGQSEQKLAKEGRLLPRRPLLCPVSKRKPTLSYSKSHHVHYLTIPNTNVFLNLTRSFSSLNP